jgi:acyl transferase domain-containing protein/NAD(P)H-dependent flavin oxidoreductase YrpB (nitropropane dioxygenase family)/NAD(P)-dependent dehydrogenase (short-subunit alcohol dehydrogenase family)/acyl carrier protein
MLFRIIASTPPAFPSDRLVRCAFNAGYTGALDVEYCTEEEAAKVLETLQIQGVQFSIIAGGSVKRWLPLIEDVIGKGLKEVAFSPVALEEPGEIVTWLKDRDVNVLAEVTSLNAALDAVALGVDALVLKGNESGGKVGEETSFVLLQRVMPQVELPVYVRGGIGLFTAAACLAAGAQGAVLDWQLALCEEAELPEPIRRRVAYMDGSETAILGQNTESHYRCYARHGETAFAALKAEEDGMITADSESRVRGIPFDTGGGREQLRAWRGEVERRAIEKELLMIGQDGCLASGLAEEYRTLHRICDAMVEAAERQVRVGKRLNPLRENGPLAKSHGTRYPIVQGPMTRVSDRAEFAAAVADGGALPFLALALLRGSQVAKLLIQTKELLKDASWGVGVLGFVPKELRDEQLAEVKKVAPPFAIIAGGRPDQAKELEAFGIATYLHVPSPELLKSFLDAGVKRVIFEGRECGGHVGPRTSFILWESMITVLRQHLSKPEQEGKGENYHVLFAGGVHDAYSASLVSALSATLAERGVKIGVLIGTAYLFTEEAVSSGAITKQFQEEALHCSETVLVESGPGHAIRCAKTPFYDFFLQEKQRLIGAGSGKEALREALERLNLGRLRIAAKGITRQDELDGENGGYIQVNADQQRRDGMYMIGQIASLRKEICSLSTLHQDISQCHWRSKKGTSSVSSESTVSHWERPSDIAIVGMSCLLPKAQNTSQFWHNIRNKVNAITEVPEGRWNSDLYFDADRRAKDKIYSRWGGFIDEYLFDPAKYGMPPNTIRSIEPLQLLTLEIVKAALIDAGYHERQFDRESTAVVVGTGGGIGELGMGYGFRTMLPHYFEKAGDHPENGRRLIDRLESELPEWTEDSFAGYLLNVVAGRVSNRFDFGGANYIVDAACATALAALRLGVNELESGSSKIAVVVAADVTQSPMTYMSFSKTHALSPSGRCRTFDAAADGIVVSEGLGAVILKRLEDAVEEGDKIYAVIKGVGASSDGKDKGVTAPRPAGQVRALRRAYSKAGFSISTVGLIEAHGTGTVVGDRTEVESLSSYLGSVDAEIQSCAVGSVKSMIGHTKCTAGLAGLIKATLALHHKVVPPTMGVSQPNTQIDFSTSPFYLNTETRPWFKRSNNDPRRAGVSAFGFGGTNFHVALEEYSVSGSQSAVHNWPAELFLWRAETAEKLLESIDVIVTAITQGSVPRLCDLAAAVYWEQGRGSGTHCLAIVATTLDDLHSKLASVKKEINAGKQIKDLRGIYYTKQRPETPGKIAFLFPGQGSQRLNMLDELVQAFPLLRNILETADQWMTQTGEEPVTRSIFAPPVFSETEKIQQEQKLRGTQVAQPALGAVDMAMFHLLRYLDIYPDMVGGHSYGELVALSVAGSFTFEELMLLSVARGRSMANVTGDNSGAMAAVDADETVVKEVLNGLSQVWIANLNSPSQTVISGTRSTVESALQQFRKQNIVGKMIPVACAFHSPLVASAKEQFLSDLNPCQIRIPRLPVFSNTSAAEHDLDPEVIKNALAEHLVKPVRFMEEIEAMHEQGARIFIEAGPGRVLSGLIDKTLQSKQHLAIAMDAPNRSGLLQLVHSLAQLSLSGVPFLAYRLFEGRVEKHASVKRLLEESNPKPLSNTTWIIKDGKAMPAKSKTTNASMTENGSAKKSNQLSRLPLSSEPHHDSNGQSQKTKVQGNIATPKTTITSKPNTNGRSVMKQTEKAIETAVNPVSANGVNGHSRQEGVDAVLLEHHQLMGKFLEAHKSVMLSYFGGTEEPYMDPAVTQERALPVNGHVEHLMPNPNMGKEERKEQRILVPQPNPVVASRSSVEPLLSPKTAIVESRSLDNPAPTREAVVKALLDVVTERTGYPEEMLGLNLDIEADLGIDSIKRVEILGALQNVSYLPKGIAEGSGIETLAQLKTLGEIVDWISGQSGLVHSSPVPVEKPSAQSIPSVQLGNVNDAKVSVIAATPISKETIVVKLKEIVTERTGYPDDMLGLDLDIEADLGIDSIKRVEILGALQSTGVLPGEVVEKQVETLAQFKTLGEIADWVFDQMAQPSETGKKKQSNSQPNASDDIESIELVRQVVTVADAPWLAQPQSIRLDGLLLITQDGNGLSTLLAERLKQFGIESFIIDPNVELGWLNDEFASNQLTEIRNRHDRIAGVIHLVPAASMADPKEDRAQLDRELLSLFSIAKSLHEDLTTNESSTVIAVTRMGGVFGHTNDFTPRNGAVCGLVKTIAREYPKTHCKCVDFDDFAELKQMVDMIIAEMAGKDQILEVGYREGRRYQVASVPRAIELCPEQLTIDSNSIVLVTGGARGITAEIALELAQRFQPKLILVGRSVFESNDADGLPAHFDERQLKTALIGQLKEKGVSPTPAIVERELNSILNGREMRVNLEKIMKAGSEVEYHSLDVGNESEFGDFIEQLYQRKERIDVVIHGAGIIQDKLIRDKPLKSFEQVLKPKINGALTLSQKLRMDSLKALVFFSSVSARYGNRGQSDYAAANEMLNKLALWLNQRSSGRVTSLNWGPWKSGRGMVSSELATRFAEAGVQLITPQKGRDALVDELLYGNKEDVEVLFGGPLPGSFKNAQDTQDSNDKFDFQNIDASHPLLIAAAGLESMTPSGHNVRLRILTSPDRYTFLTDHELDGKPTIPMAVVLELAAEMASAAFPQKEVVGVKDVRVLRGINYQGRDESKWLDIDTVRSDQSLAFTLNTGGKTPNYRVTVELEERIPNATSAVAVPLKLECPTGFNRTLDFIYSSWLFHGPAFAVITDIESIGENGIIARLRPSQTDTFFEPPIEGSWVIDPAVVDGGLQLVVLWARHYLDQTPLPSRIGHYHRYAKSFPDSIRCEVRVEHIPGNPVLKGDIKFFDETGKLLGWLEGMEGTCSKELNRLALRAPVERVSGLAEPSQGVPLTGWKAE